mmetsp:Transcript_57176/g.145164  ORF Transcript_57176/g.145164 Transcript_57176/m.145164 type:complete len:209 (+) Transcript_57176:1371-1997(+)
MCFSRSKSKPSCAALVNRTSCSATCCAKALLSPSASAAALAVVANLASASAARLQSSCFSFCASLCSSSNRTALASASTTLTRSACFSLSALAAAVPDTWSCFCASLSSLASSSTRMERRSARCSAFSARMEMASSSRRRVVCSLPLAVTSRCAWSWYCFISVSRAWTCAPRRWFSDFSPAAVFAAASAADLAPSKSRHKAVARSSVT